MESQNLAQQTMTMIGVFDSSEITRPKNQHPQNKTNEEMSANLIYIEKTKKKSNKNFLHLFLCIFYAGRRKGFCYLINYIEADGSKVKQ